MTAVAKDGRALMYASKELKSGGLAAFLRALLNDRRRFEHLLLLAGCGLPSPRLFPPLL